MLWLIILKRNLELLIGGLANIIFRTKIIMSEWVLDTTKGPNCLLVTSITIIHWIFGVWEWWWAKWFSKKTTSLKGMTTTINFIRSHEFLAQTLCLTMFKHTMWSLNLHMILFWFSNLVDSGSRLWMKTTRIWVLQMPSIC